ncbi:MAG: hypothetical protein ACTSR0_05965 [Candidatus Asgardarchaeia archaeon]
MILDEKVAMGTRKVKQIEEKIAKLLLEDEEIRKLIFEKIRNIEKVKE